MSHSLLVFFFCTALAILASSVVQRDPLQLHKMHQMYQISPSLCWGNSEAHEDYELHKDKKKIHNNFLALCGFKWKLNPRLFRKTNATVTVGETVAWPELLQTCSINLQSCCFWNGCFRDREQVSDSQSLSSKWLWRQQDGPKTATRPSYCVINITLNGVKLAIACSLFLIIWEHENCLLTSYIWIRAIMICCRVGISLQNCLPTLTFAY